MFNKKTILSVLATATISLVAIVYVHQKQGSLTDLVSVNVAALSDGEGGGINCNDVLCVLFDYKNKILLSGCKYKEDHTCTVKSPDININL